MSKPVVKLSGENGNVWNLLAICCRALKAEGRLEDSKELTDKVLSESDSYEEAIRHMADYCDII